MKILLIRHGRTAGNAGHRYVGKTDEDIIETSVEEIREHYLDMDVDLVFSSPMKRCVHTAELLFEEKSIETVQNLTECDFGEFEYKSYEELNGNPDYQMYIDSGGEAAFPGGESKTEFSARTVEAFVEILDRVEELEAACGRELTVAFVVHGGTIMAVMERLALPQRDYFEWQVKNLHGYILTVTKGTSPRRLICEREL